LELSIAITKCVVFQSPEERMTFSVKRHRGECGLLQTIPNHCILEFSCPITEQMWAVKADPQVSFGI
jgi:hypothetical protein